MRDPYKIVVWGPGGLGAVTIWEVLQSDAFELVGVKAYDPAKEGKDIGELMGLGAVGVTVTTDIQKALEIDCDCVVMTARDTGDFNTDDEIIQILEAGRNLVTPLPYHNAYFFRDQSFVDRLRAACEKGQSVFHASGIDPDLVSDRVVPAITGMCSDIKSIKLQENWDSSSTTADLLAIVGFGKSVAEASAVPVAAAISTNFLKSITYSMEEVMGVKYDRVEETHDYIEAHHDIESMYINIRKGDVARVTHRMQGFVDSKGPEPFFTIEYNWVIGDSMLPEGVNPGEKWVITIEGRPSIKTVMEMRASHYNEDRLYQIGNLQTEPGYHATMAPCLQAIPKICAAEPGWLPSFGATLHWMQDYRELAPSPD
jgi:hypothetical protein